MRCSHVPLVHHKQVKWELGKGSQLLPVQLSLHMYFVFCSVKRLTLWYMTVCRTAVVLLPGLSVLSWCRKGFLPQPVCSRFPARPCCAHMHVVPLHVLPKTGDGLFSFMVLVLFFPKAFQIAPLKVTSKMSLIETKGKFHLPVLPFDISQA